MDYPLKENFPEDPDKTPAPQSTRCKYSKDLRKEFATRNYELHVKDKTAGHLKMPILEKDVPKKA